MSTGNIITLIALFAFAMLVIYFVINARREAKQIELSKKHGPRTGALEFDRAQHIQKGGLGSGGLEK